MNPPSCDALETLRGKAARADAWLLVATCDLALAGDSAALLECAIALDDGWVD